MRLGIAAAIAIAFFARAEIAEAACTDAGACASTEYCATHAGDGGVVVTDGGAGVCLPEPCIVSTDCTNGDLCDTNEQPFGCVQCISTANCSGDLLCDTATHECVAPIGADGGSDASEGEDAAVDGGELDATVPIFPADASGDANEASSPPLAFDAGPDTGSLEGGACDCSLATIGATGVAPLGAPFALGLLFVTRRRRCSKPKRRR